MKSSFTVRYHHDIVNQPLKVEVGVKQQEQYLYKKIIDLRCYNSPLHFEFEFKKLDPVELIFAVENPLISVYPLYIDRIQLDGLIDIPSIAHCGMSTDKDKSHPVGNCLYCVGQLTYKFKLPMCANANFTI